jgi:hypothetical protein
MFTFKIHFKGLRIRAKTYKYTPHPEENLTEERAGWCKNTNSNTKTKTQNKSKQTSIKERD